MRKNFLVNAALLGVLATLPAAAQTTARGILQSNCMPCHGEAQMSGLDLRTREAMLRGGKRGPSLLPGNAAESILLKAVERSGELQMPPGKKGLSASEIAILKSWIDGGAAMETHSKQEEAGWWAFRVPRRPSIPATASTWATNDLDRLLEDGLRAQGLTPSPLADRQTLVRRAYFDLHGLPPGPAEVDQFLKDGSPEAWTKLIDRLLDSPRYGERWGRHWLDVARYADTGGYETDVYLANAWRYRDYVINSFNQDKPYNTFVQEQIAADEIWPDDLDLDGSYDLPKQKQVNLARRIGTGLFTIGPMAAEYTFFGDQYRAEWQADSVDTVGSAFLGLTTGCARCHDHKFDPISQLDYYRMAALFAGSEDREIPIVSRMGIYEYTRYQTRLRNADELKAKLQRMDAEVRKRDAANRKAQPREDDEPLPYTAAEKDQRETLLRQIGQAYVTAPKMYAMANLLVHSDRVPESHILIRGEFKQKGEKVSPGFLSALNKGPEIVEPEGNLFVPQRRKALAEWITAPDQPLLARVMVNRIWQGHFGEGLVSTPNDFGRQGEPPSHPKLLDWLATEFTSHNYSIKHMHRVILQSSAYRMASLPQPENARIDPDNRYFWRMNRRRLEAEEVRDAALYAAGALNGKMGGPPIAVPLTKEERGGMRDFSQWPVSSDPADFDRRSVYLMVKRSFRLPMLETFDAPDTTFSCARREASTVAPQALALLNSEFTAKQSARLAARLQREYGGNTGALVDAGFRLTLGRAPAPEERAKALQFLERNPLPSLCLLWFNLSEFLYVD